ncbi:MAG: sulfotransferase domain-containing protein [Pseudomonadota bacterium]
MLIINNGYGKSGTTWIQRGLRYYFSFSNFDRRYQNPKLANASIDPALILTFIQETDLSSSDYYSKSHWAANVDLQDGRLAQALLKMPDTVVVNSIRNIGDSTVSWYHHQKRDGEERDFGAWFWDKGVGFIHRYLSHHMSWAQTERPPFLFCYEQLKLDPHAAFQRFLSSVGRTDDRPVDDFNRHMDFKTSQAETQSQHMRKGVVGDWVHYFDGEMLENVDDQVRKRRFFDKCGRYLETYDVEQSDIMPTQTAPQFRGQ